MMMQKLARVFYKANCIATCQTELVGNHGDVKQGKDYSLARGGNQPRFCSYQSGGLRAPSNNSLIHTVSK